MSDTQCKKTMPSQNTPSTPGFAVMALAGEPGLVEMVLELCIDDV